MNTVMTIAGFDPSGGAGLLADIKTISAFGCYGVAVATSLTYQSTVGVFGSRDLTRDEVRSQMMPLLADFEIAAVKMGMLPTAEIVEEVAACLRERFPNESLPKTVIDPVICSTSGYRLVSGEAIEASKRLLFPMAVVVTPNWKEASVLAGSPVGDAASAEIAGRRILSMGPRAVVVTGGDSTDEFVVDLLVEPSRTAVFRGERLKSTSTHGTGCTFSSAIACLLSSGEPLEEAVRRAKTYVENAIRRAEALGRGAGPLNHLHRGITD
jgi:hydroxymethylpyrimidine kinase/phosphomethylpyrimidine kinase